MGHGMNMVNATPMFWMPSQAWRSTWYRLPRINGVGLWISRVPLGAFPYLTGGPIKLALSEMTNQYVQLVHGTGG